MIRVLTCSAAAVLALLLVAPVHRASTAYGAETLVWDAGHATYTYVERPGGFVVLALGALVCAALVVGAVLATAMAVRAAARGPEPYLRRV